MPLALQAKMLRFLECGELQRVGENETMRVDVRVIAATHQPLGEAVQRGGRNVSAGSVSPAGGVSGGGAGAARADGGRWPAGGAFSGGDGEEMPRKRLTAARGEAARSITGRAMCAS